MTKTDWCEVTVSDLLNFGDEDDLLDFLSIQLSGTPDGVEDLMYRVEDFKGGDVLIFEMTGEVES